METPTSDWGAGWGQMERRRGTTQWQRVAGLSQRGPRLPPCSLLLAEWGKAGGSDGRPPGQACLHARASQESPEQRRWLCMSQRAPVVAGCPSPLFPSTSFPWPTWHIPAPAFSKGQSFSKGFNPSHVSLSRKH